MAASTARETTALLTAIRSGADALCRLAAGDRWTDRAAEELAAGVAAAGAVDLRAARAELCSRTLADARLLTLPPGLAAEAVVRMLGALAPVRGVSLWTSGGEPGAACLRAAAGAAAAEARAAAESVLAAAGPGTDGGLLAVPVRSWGRTAAALVLDVEAGEWAQAAQLAADAASALAVVLEREALLERNGERERELVEAGERRLARLAFDIHDGPLQTVAALGLELGLLGADVPPERAGHIRDLHERVAALETELRELTHTLEPTSIARRPLDATLARQAESFSRQHDVAVQLETSGDIGALTPSQRIALVRVVHEALTNARDHGGATEVRVAVVADRRGVTAHVTDNGCGFDVGSALPAAARKGRLGLVGMSERMRLLGGRLEVESRAGGPTTIEASLPRWSPLARTAADAEHASAHAVAAPA